MKYILEKFQPYIESVEDLEKLFSTSFPGRRHLWLAIRNLLKYCKTHGWPQDYINLLLQNMPPIPRTKNDNYVPKEEHILKLFEDLKKAKKKYSAFYNIILDSALRPAHAVEILADFRVEKLERVFEGVYKYHMSIERREKHTFIVFLTDHTLKLIESMEEPITLNGYKVFQKRHKLLRPKLVQKFAYNMMRRSGVDRDVAEFISGRKPEGVGARHYAELIMLAEDQYPKYFRYLEELRKKSKLFDRMN